MEAGLRNLDKDVVAFDRHWVNRNASLGNVDRVPGNGIELPAMPWADELAVVDDASAKRTTTMRTDVIQRGELAIDAGDAELPTRAPDFLG